VSLGVALACLLSFGLLGYLLYPIISEASGHLAQSSAARSELEDLYIQREGTYATLKELEFDHETGKLIEEDYRELRARYSGEAVRILRRIDELEAASPGPGDRPKKAASGRPKPVDASNAGSSR